MAEKHFEEQKIFAAEYLLPYLETLIPNLPEMNVLEAGCAEGGLLEHLAEQGIRAAGVELSRERVELAHRIDPELDVKPGDITDPAVLQMFPNRFGLIIMRDVIEHIPHREAAFRILWDLLEPGGYLYITFPPRFSPFAGHQQHARSFLKHTPYVSLLPEWFWYWLGRRLGETDDFLESVMHNYRIGLSIRRFERLYRQQGFSAVRRDLFLLRPAFKFRFGTPIVRFPNIPFLREFKATGCEYLLRKPENG